MQQENVTRTKLTANAFKRCKAQSNSGYWCSKRCTVHVLKGTQVSFTSTNVKVKFSQDGSRRTSSTIRILRSFPKTRDQSIHWQSEAQVFVILITKMHADSMFGLSGTFLHAQDNKIVSLHWHSAGQEVPGHSRCKQLGALGCTEPVLQLQDCQREREGGGGGGGIHSAPKVWLRMLNTLHSTKDEVKKRMTKFCQYTFSESDLASTSRLCTGECSYCTKGQY